MSSWEEQFIKSWRELIDELSGGDKLIACTLTDEELDVKFQTFYGEIEGKSFVAWSEEYVYFAFHEETMEDVARFPRNPCSIDNLKHVGDRQAQALLTDDFSIKDFFIKKG